MSGLEFSPAQIADAKGRLDLVQLLIEDGYEPRREGRLHRVHCPFMPERTPSCIVDEQQIYHCFGCGAHGDAITYLVEKRGQTFVEIIRAALQLPEPAVRPKVNRTRKHTPQLPPPAKAEAIRPTFRHFHHGDPVAVWWYLGPDGRRLMADVRYEYQHEGSLHKDVITWCWARSIDGSEGWVMTRPETGMPLYGLDRLADRADAAVVLAEGCKSAEGAQLHLPELVAMSWCGGVDSVRKSERHAWAALAGRRVWLWPDMDFVGINAMCFALDHLRAAGAEVLGVIGAPDYFGRKKGWDAADATADEAARLWASRSEEPEAALRRLAAALPRPLNDDGTPRRLTVHPHLATPDAGAEGEPEDAAPPAADGSSAPPTDPAPATAGDDDRPDEAGDMEAASRFVERHGKDLLFCPTLGSHGTWYVWDGMRYRADLDGEIMRRAEDTARAIRAVFAEQAKSLHVLAKQMDAVAGDESKPSVERANAGLKAKRLRDQAGRLTSKGDQACNLKRLENMIALARSRSGIPVPHTELDADPWLLNCLSGIIDLRTGVLWKHDRKWRCTRLAPVPYDPDATHPHLQKVIKHLARGDAEVAQFLQDAIGGTISGDNRWEHFFLLHGQGRDGKGALFRGIKAALGDYAATAASQTFLKLDGQRIRNDLARLQGFHLVISAEIEKGSTLDVAVVKALSGGDDIVSRFLHNEEFEYRPRFTIWLQCNDRPVLDAADDAIWERLVCIPVGRKLEAHERDPAVKATLGDPAIAGPAILAWLVRGAVRMHKAKRLVLPEVVRKATVAYRGEMDQVGEFLRDHVRIGNDPTGAIDTICTIKDMTKEFESYCLDIGIPPGRAPMRRLRELLRYLGCFSKSHRHLGAVDKCWFGCTLAKSEHTVARITYTPSEEASLAILAACNRVTVPDPSGYTSVTAETAAKTGDASTCNQVTEKTDASRDARTHAGAGAHAPARVGDAHAPTDAVTWLHPSDNEEKTSVNTDKSPCNRSVTGADPFGYTVTPPRSDTLGDDLEGPF